MNNLTLEQILHNISVERNTEYLIKDAEFAIKTRTDKHGAPYAIVLYDGLPVCTECAAQNWDEIVRDTRSAAGAASWELSTVGVFFHEDEKCDCCGALIPCAY